MTLAWLRPARHDKKRSDKAPQQQCYRARRPNDGGAQQWTGFAHSAHQYEDNDGLIWSCQGRGAS